jgi:hypothetical protein
VVLRKVLEQESEFPQVGHIHQVGVVKDSGEGLAGVVEAERLFDQPAFAFESVAFELDAERFAQDFDGIGIGVQGACDCGDEVLVVGQSLESLLDDGLAGAGHAKDETESSLLTMDCQCVVNLLLLGQQFEVAEVEGVMGQAIE